MGTKMGRSAINMTSVTFLGHTTMLQGISQSALNKGQEEVSSNGRLFNSCVSQNFSRLHPKQVLLARIKGRMLQLKIKGITTKHGFAAPSGRGQRPANSQATKQRV